ncbi:hypothetical protein HOY80DRAFT_986830 [Tuber brumale]|nr:hypothetical protein HOY80DRAFT_986830 [Tuber brumale]
MTVRCLCITFISSIATGNFPPYWHYRAQAFLHPSWIMIWGGGEYLYLGFSVREANGVSLVPRSLSQWESRKF